MKDAQCQRVHRCVILARWASCSAAPDNGLPLRATSWNLHVLWQAGADEWMASSISAPSWILGWTGSDELLAGTAVGLHRPAVLHAEPSLFVGPFRRLRVSACFGILIPKWAPSLGS